MTWAVPSVWAFALLALAAYRTWKLLAEDTILDRPRDALLRRTGDKTEWFLLCPWCCGAWLSLGIWLCWIWQPHWTLVASTPAALSAAVGLIATNLDSE